MTLELRWTAAADPFGEYNLPVRSWRNGTIELTAFGRGVSQTTARSTGW